MIVVGDGSRWPHCVARLSTLSTVRDRVQCDQRHACEKRPPLAPLRMNSIGSIRAHTRGKAYAVDLWIGHRLLYSWRSAPRGIARAAVLGQLEVASVGPPIFYLQAPEMRPASPSSVVSR